MSEILGTVVERDIRMSFLGTNGNQCFVLWSSLGTSLPHTDKYFEKVQ